MRGESAFSSFVLLVGVCQMIAFDKTAISNNTI